MTPSATPESVLGKQLLAEMEDISRTPFPIMWGQNQWEQARVLEGEQQRVRVLTNYVVQLLDRIEKLESRLGSE
jgi:hypothetical protein